MGQGISLKSWNFKSLLKTGKVGDILILGTTHGISWNFASLNLEYLTSSQPCTTMIPDKWQVMDGSN